MSHTVILGDDGAGDVRPLRVDTSGILVAPAGVALDATIQTLDAAVDAMSVKLPAAIGPQTTAAALAVALSSDHADVSVDIGANTAGLALDATLATLDSAVDAMSAKLPAAVGAQLTNASLSVALASDHADVSVDIGANTAGLATDATLATLDSAVDAMSAKLPAALGQATEAGSMSVVIASDQSPVDVSCVPQTVGSQANAWDGAVPGVDGDSAVIDCQYASVITVLINTSGATDITPYISHDNVTFYEDDVNKQWGVDGDKVFTFSLGARYVRLRNSTAAITITATVAGKS